MSNNCLCEVCKRMLYVDRAKTIKHVYKDNELGVFFGRCFVCNSRFGYFEKGSINEFVFVDKIIPQILTMSGQKIRDIYISYTPVYSFLEENKRIILENKKNDDIVIGFDGWEDVVLNKDLAGSWFLTQNSPPMLDVYVYQLKRFVFSQGDVIYSYFPSPMVEELEIKYSILDDRDFEFFDRTRKLMIERYRKFYIGVKKNGQ